MLASKAPVFFLLFFLRLGVGRGGRGGHNTRLQHWFAIRTRTKRTPTRTRPYLGGGGGGYSFPTTTAVVTTVASLALHASTLGGEGVHVLRAPFRKSIS